MNLYQYLIEFTILLINVMMRLIYYANMQNKPKIMIQYRIEIKSESSTPSTVCPKYNQNNNNTDSSKSPRAVPIISKESNGIFQGL